MSTVGRNQRIFRGRYPTDSDGSVIDRVRSLTYDTLALNTIYYDWPRVADSLLGGKSDEIRFETVLVGRGPERRSRSEPGHG